MSDLLKSLSLAALIAVAGPAVAQDAAPAAESAATLAAPVMLETYVDEQFDDWQRECLRMPEGAEGADPCRMVQVLKDAAGNPVGKIAIGRQPAGSNAAASGEIALPTDMGIYLPEGISIGVDEGLTKTYGFYRCLPDACTSQLRFTADDVTAFKAGTVMRLNLVAFLPEDRRQPLRLQIPVSLKGFTKAFDSLAVPVLATEAAPAPAPAPAAEEAAPAAEQAAPAAQEAAPAAEEAAPAAAE